MQTVSGQIDDQREVAMELALLEKLPINVLVIEDVAAFSAAVVAMLRYSLTNTSTILVASSLAEAAKRLSKSTSASCF